VHYLYLGRSAQWSGASKNIIREVGLGTLIGGLIQMSLKGDTGQETAAIRDVMLEAHLPLIEQSGKAGVQVLCLQEVFTQPYFCPSQDAKWYAAAETIPEGPTVSLMQELAKKHSMVIVVPIFEEHITGVYYNTAAVIDADGSYLGKYRKTHIPQVAGFYEKFFFKPGNSGWPVFDTAYCKLGVYICYDRHFPEGWRALAMNGAEYIVNPSATVAGLSQYLWELEQPAAAVANGCYIGAVNRVGTEAPWDIGQFYGSSYFVNPRGQIIAQASATEDELLVAEMDLDLIREVRDLWQFFRDRRPEMYASLSAVDGV
jgi:N-carbamoylputrescine amidase